MASCKSDDIIFSNFVSVVESSPIRNKEICLKDTSKLWGCSNHHVHKLGGPPNPSS